MTTAVIRVYSLVSLVVMNGVPFSDQLPVRQKEGDPRLIPTAEDSLASPDVVPDTPDPLENIGVEPNQGFLIEGDIRVWHRPPTQEHTETGTNSPDSYASYPQETNSHMTRNSVVAEETWLERVIPYVIDPTFSVTEKQIIFDAINEIMAAVNNCTVFVEREKQEDFLYITGQQLGCWSDVGKIGGNQTVSISRASECVTKGIIMHELLHSLGFWHEHNRPDRDNYIQILRHNIRIDHIGDFDINKNGKMLVEYDYYSIMHYKTNQFSKDHFSLDTIRILKPGIDESQVGQRNYLSDKDKERIVRLYQCRKFVRSGNSTQSSESLGHQEIQQLSLPNSPKINENELNLQNGTQTVVNNEAALEKLPSTVTVNPNKPEIVSKSNFTETAEVGRK